MELDFKKKIVIGIFIVIILAISAYLYYDYMNDGAKISIEESETENEIVKSDVRENEEKDENIIVIHIAGAVNNPRNCKNSRGS